MDRLPNAFYGALPDRVRFGAEVHAIDQDADGVTVHYKTEAGRFRERGDYGIIAIPFSVLRSVETLTPVLTGEAARHPAAQLPRLDEDPVPGAEPALGDGGRDRSRRVGDRPRHPPHELPHPEPDHDARHAAGVVHVGTGRAAVGRDGRGDATRGGTRRRRPPPSVDPRGVRRRRVVRLVRRPLGARRVRACSRPSSRPSCKRRSSSQRAGSCSPASTARCTTRGFRGRWRAASAPPDRSTR